MFSIYLISAFVHLINMSLGGIAYAPVFTLSTGPILLPPPAQINIIEFKLITSSVLVCVIECEV